jgi:preprotein translocase subunit SecA
MSEPGIGAPLWLLPPPVLLPQRNDSKARWLDRLETIVTGVPALALPGLLRARLSRIIAITNAEEAALRMATDDVLMGEARELRRLLRLRGLRIEPVARAFGLIRELANRTVGLRHFDVQLLGGFVLLKGMLAEMETGEGKTLTATLAAGTAALAGIPVHIVTVNDYLATRDAEAMSPIYRALGLTVGVIVHGKTAAERRAAYACDITYATNKEIAFDYLRDRLVLGGHSENLRLKLERLYGEAPRLAGVVMRGLHFAIVDEADSVLIDEARTPLIISGNPQSIDDRRWSEEALTLARGLEIDTHYRIAWDERRIELTALGISRIGDLGQELGGLWLSRIRREESVRQALTAIHLFSNSIQYIVREGKIEIVDEYTGRIMPDRNWNEGLHQLIEAKEGCEVTERKAPLARISYQRFFRRYHRLGGMTGTAREVSGELWSVYRLPVITIPTNRPVRRQDRPAQVCATAEEKLGCIVAKASLLHSQGRPVLIGTRSVASSVALSERLDLAGLSHVVLNAEQDQHEAAIIADAGKPGRITVATNMAGRGVDIQLGEGVAARGGLQVILSERHEAGRIDRQLIGRCGRQGEPGTTEAILSLDDPLLGVLGWAGLRNWLCRSGPWSSVFSRFIFRHAQRRAERVHSRMRRRLLTADQRLGTMLAFSGEME